MPAITDIEGLQVGHAHDEAALTGCTAILCPPGTVAGVDVAGGAPGTRETDLLDPTAMVEHIHALALCGGSALGLAAASGVMRWLYERGRGFRAGPALVPIVPAAVIFDLSLGRPDAWPDEAMGYAACEAAGSEVAEGCVGVGIGASAGKLRGMAAATKSGLGTWSETLPDGTTVGALVVCNPFGDISADGRIVAGLRDLERGGFAGTSHLLRTLPPNQAFGGPPSGNTTLAVVATDATLTKAEATRLARMAQDALPRAIRPIHTLFDGDVVFSLATCRRPAPPLVVLGSLAADVLQRAIERAALSATAMGGLPAARDIAAS